jgi:proteasome lid subunit RPN8/RPN11
MIEDALSTFPDECCGFLFGNETETEEERITLQAMVVNNAKEGDKRRRFAITAKDYLNAERYAEENNLLLLGVYHSHPNHPAVPSEHDRLAAQPYFSYVILSIINNEYAGLRSWRLNEEQQFEEEIIYDRQFI